MQKKCAGARMALAAAVLSLSAMASAATVVVTPSDPTWGNPPGENGGGGSSAITGTAPRSGNGSVEMFGDRTRFVGLGNFYDPTSNLGLLDDVLSLVFDWMIATDSTRPAGADPDYTPALRLHVWDGAQRSELIWEGAYNGTYGNTAQGTFYTSGASDSFWRFQSGVGVTFDNGAQVGLSIRQLGERRRPQRQPVVQQQRLRLGDQRRRRQQRRPALPRLRGQRHARHRRGLHDLQLRGHRPHGPGAGRPRAAGSRRPGGRSRRPAQAQLIVRACTDRAPLRRGFSLVRRIRRSRSGPRWSSCTSGENIRTDGVRNTARIRCGRAHACAAPMACHLRVA